MTQTILYIILIVVGVKLLGFGLVTSAYSGSVIPLVFVLIGGGMVVFGVLRARNRPISN